MAKKTTKKSPPKKQAANKKAKSSSKSGKIKKKAAKALKIAKAPKVSKVLKASKAFRISKPTKASTKKIAPIVEAKSLAKVAAKPGKFNAGISARDLARYRELLLAKRRELLGDVDSMEDEALRNSGGSNLSNLPIHMADMGTDNYEQEFTLGLVEKDRNLLREIHLAIAKMQEGTYGICEGTGKPIGKPRLEAQPWTRFSIEYARELEKNRMRRP